MKEKTNEVKSQVGITISSLMTVAFGLIAALAWNETIKTVIAQLLPKGNDITGLLIYAVLVTIIAIVATILITKALGKPPVQEVRIVE